jgi:hypothetical protein
MEQLANVTDLEILRECLDHSKKQKGRAIGHAIAANKAKNTPTPTPILSASDDASPLDWEE